ncbi:MAG TPA: metalloregulator ArsR/SmtB family transcription factor [Tepidisphaeraceae bacterium]|jgi:DNA-binding transcriptional ArsR family regulator|nr:metalloregulator ArsR/SmtB family transcription factor [Tepidisphaeraceae bacterium]
MSVGSDARVWRALSNAARRRMLDLLRDRALTTTALAAHFPSLSRFAVMQHLRVLERAQLVIVRREGRERYNQLNVAPIQMIYDRWVSRYARPAASAAAALKHFVEKEGVTSCPTQSPSCPSRPHATKSRSTSTRRLKPSGARSRRT